MSHINLELVNRQLAEEIKGAKSFTFVSQPSFRGPFTPVTRTIAAGQVSDLEQIALTLPR